MNKTWIWKGASFLLAGALLYWFLRNTAWGDIQRGVQEADLGWLALSLSLSLVSWVWRALRWGVFFRHLKKVRFRNLLTATVIGFAANSALSFRVGEFVRPVLLSRREGLSVSTAFATVVVERVFDLIVVLGLFAITPLVFDLGPYLPGGSEGSFAVIRHAGFLSLLTCIGMGLVLFAFHARTSKAMGVFRLVSHLLPGWLSSRAERLLCAFSEGLGVLGSLRCLILALGYSVVLWLGLAVSAWFVFLGFHLNLPFFGMLTLLVLMVLGAAVPTPAAIGGFHQATKYGLVHLFNVPESTAVAPVVVLHALSFFPVILMGLVFLAQEGLTFKSLGGDSEGFVASPSPGNGEGVASKGETILEERP
ncbi:MAG: flippase-like domain-containing protein [Acidobacteria bacterium]|nr:flippase-like domain-containing protein [Acidobacteriota bacterium]